MLKDKAVSFGTLWFFNSTVFLKLRLKLDILVFCIYCPGRRVGRQSWHAPRHRPLKHPPSSSLHPDPDREWQPAAGRGQGYKASAEKTANIPFLKWYQFTPRWHPQQHKHYNNRSVAPKLSSGFLSSWEKPLLKSSHLCEMFWSKPRNRVQLEAIMRRRVVTGHWRPSCELQLPTPSKHS